MFEKIINFSIRNKLVIGIMTLLLVRSLILSYSSIKRFFILVRIPVTM